MFLTFLIVTYFKSTKQYLKTLISTGSKEASVCATRYQSNNCQDNQLESTEGGSKSTKHTFFFQMNFSAYFQSYNQLQSPKRNTERERRKNKKLASWYLTVLEIIFQQTESLRSKFLLQTSNYLSLSPPQRHTGV